MKKLLLACLATLLCASSWAYDFIEGGIYYNITSSSDLTVEVTYETYGKATFGYTGDFVVPETVEHGGVTYTVTAIGESGFEYATISSISLPETITQISHYGFADTPITQIDIPSSVTRIENYGFKGTSLVDVVVPDNVEHLGWDVFESCMSLKTVVIGNGLDELPSWAFEYDTALESVTLGNAIVKVGQYVFYGCTSLKEVTIPNSTTQVSSLTFHNCTSLEKVTLGESVDDLGQYLFSGCTALTELYSLNPTPPTCRSDVFHGFGAEDLDMEKCVLYVPKGSKRAYAAADQWCDFANIVEMDEMVEEEVLLYSTDFTDWETIDRTKASGVEATVQTTTGDDLTFSFWGVGVDPEKTDSEKFPDYTGAMITAKYMGEYTECEPYAVTSALGSITKIEFTQVATGSNRGIKISVKGDGDEDWVALFDQAIGNAKGETWTLDVDRTNCQVKFESYNLDQNAYVADLKIYGNTMVAAAQQVEKALYSTSWVEWDELDRASSDVTRTVTTNYTNEELTFTFNGAGVSPTGTNEDKFPGYTGWMITAKYPEEYEAGEPSVVTSALESITRIELTQVATGNTRGIKVSVKGDGDEDWVVLHEANIGNAKGEDLALEVNRTNCQVKFGTVNTEQNAYVVDLKIYGMAPEDAHALTFSPVSGQTVESLGTIVVTCDAYLDLDRSLGSEIVVADASGETVTVLDYTEIDYPEPDVSCTMHLLDEVTDPGTYTVSIPAGYFIMGDEGIPSDAITLVYAIAGDDDDTGIKATAVQGAATGDGYYNLNGQRVATPRNGVYILDGKKVVVK